MEWGFELVWRGYTPFAPDGGGFVAAGAAALFALLALASLLVGLIISALRGFAGLGYLLAGLLVLFALFWASV